MSWMNNMRVAYKLLVLNVIAIIGMIVVGMVGYFAVMQAQKDLDTISQTYLKGIFEIGRCRHAVRYAQVQSILAPLTTDPALLQSRIDKYNGAVKELDESLALYEEIIKNDPQARAQVDAAKREWAKFKAGGDKMMQLRSPVGSDLQTLANHRATALEFYQSDVMPYAVSTGGAILEIQQKAYQDSEDTIARSNEGIDAAVRNLFIALGGTFVILIFFSFTITKAITGPLGNMVQALHLLKGGDFRRTDLLDADRADEFGAMALAVREKLFKRQATPQVNSPRLPKSLLQVLTKVRKPLNRLRNPLRVLQARLLSSKPLSMTLWRLSTSPQSLSKLLP